MCLEILVLIVHSPIYLETQYTLEHRTSSKIKVDPPEDKSGQFYANQLIAFFTIFRALYFTFKVSIPAFSTSLTPELAR